MAQPRGVQQSTPGKGAALRDTLKLLAPKHRKRCALATSQGHGARRSRTARVAHMARFDRRAAGGSLVKHDRSRCILRKSWPLPLLQGRMERRPSENAFEPRDRAGRTICGDSTTTFPLYYCLKNRVKKSWKNGSCTGVKTQSTRRHRLILPGRFHLMVGNFSEFQVSHYHGKILQYILKTQYQRHTITSHHPAFSVCSRSHPARSASA